MKFNFYIILQDSIIFINDTLKKFFIKKINDTDTNELNIQTNVITYNNIEYKERSSS